MRLWVDAELGPLNKGGFVPCLGYKRNMTVLKSEPTFASELLLILFMQRLILFTLLARRSRAVIVALAWLLTLLAALPALAQPSIGSFSPTSGASGSTVTIYGSGFSGVTSVRFGELSAAYTVNSSSQLTATVPRAASTQKINVTTSAGYALSASAFTVTRSNSLTYTLVASNFAGVSVGGNAAPTVGDLNGNGRLDLLVGRSDGTISRYEQTSANATTFTSLGSLSDGSTTIDMGTNSTVSILDADGDGLFSVILGRADGLVYEYEQGSEGSGTFSLVTTALGDIGTTTNSSTAFTDLEGDGLLEIIVGKGDNYIGYFEQYWLNSPSFYRINSNYLSITSNEHPTCVDLDGNGRIDVLFGEGGGSIYRFEQTSAGSTSLSQLTSSFNSISAGSNAKPCVTDLDGDGLLDLLVGRGDGTIDRYEQGGSTNSAPTNISLSGSSVAENQASGTTVGSLSTTDPNAGNTFTYSFAGSNADNGSFSIAGNTLTTNASFDYEAQSSYSIRIRSTDQGGLSFEKDFTIAVNDVAELPTISSFTPTSGGGGTVVTITGTHFQDAQPTSVTFNGVAAASVNILSNTSIQATAPSNVSTGPVRVTNADGNVTGSTFTVVPPAVSSVSVPANATYGVGQNLSFTVNFNQAVTVVTTGGTPTIALTVGSTARTASYVSGSGSAALVFRYTVLAGDLDTDGVALGSTLVLNGGTIRNGS